ncbi:unnamed protein product [Lupinus luteus]|uniref:Uncharacterized protein n=1 Tax=Lupinus luteus TaxID=3873 RepID=A0AAV1WTW0_LUPLU
MTVTRLPRNASDEAKGVLTVSDVLFAIRVEAKGVLTVWLAGSSAVHGQNIIMSLSAFKKLENPKEIQRQRHL